MRRFPSNDGQWERQASPESVEEQQVQREIAETHHEAPVCDQPGRDEERHRQIE
jgi:hypothetical protein